MYKVIVTGTFSCVLAWLLGAIIMHDRPMNTVMGVAYKLWNWNLTLCCSIGMKWWLGKSRFLVCQWYPISLSGTHYMSIHIVKVANIGWTLVQTSISVHVLSLEWLHYAPINVKLHLPHPGQTRGIRPPLVVYPGVSLFFEGCSRNRSINFSM